MVLVITVTTPVFGEQKDIQSENGIEVEKEEISTETEEEEKPAKRKRFWERQKEKDPNRGRFLPIPVFITEPAIGEGLGVVLAYFHPKKEVSNKDRLASLESLGGASSEQEPPPTVTGIFGAYTSNDTAAAGVGHMNTFKDDHIRFTGAAAWANVNSTFYIKDNPYKFNLEGYLAYQETRFRFGDSRWGGTEQFDFPLDRFGRVGLHIGDHLFIYFLGCLVGDQTAGNLDHRLSR